MSNYAWENSVVYERTKRGRDACVDRKDIEGVRARPLNVIRQGFLMEIIKRVLMGQ